jgi:mannose-1-phosphate guanylyltransferase
MSEAFVLILAGGGGTRLWPASRRSQPKQLLTLGGQETLLGATFRRASGLVGAANVFVVTAEDQADAIRSSVPQLPAAQIIVEPAPRNTGPAVVLGAVAIARRAGLDARIAVLPSDAYIGDEQSFLTAARTAFEHAKSSIVTIGIKPTAPETGYGYVAPGESAGNGAAHVDKFVEKPDRKRAEAYLEKGYLWNAGMFFLTVERLLTETRTHLPALGRIADGLLDTTQFEQAAEEEYVRAPSISIDFGIMEKASGIRVVPGDFGWNDVGSWSALSAVRDPDEKGNIAVGQTIALDTENSVIYSAEGAPLIAALGARDLIIVATRDAVLVSQRDQAQDVKKVVEALKQAGREDLV